MEPDFIELGLRLKSCPGDLGRCLEYAETASTTSSSRSSSDFASPYRQPGASPRDEDSMSGRWAFLEGSQSFPDFEDHLTSSLTEQCDDGLTLLPGDDCTGGADSEIGSGLWGSSSCYQSAACAGTSEASTDEDSECDRDSCLDSPANLDLPSSVSSWSASPFYSGRFGQCLAQSGTREVRLMHLESKEDGGGDDASSLPSVVVVKTAPEKHSIRTSSSAEEERAAWLSDGEKPLLEDLRYEAQVLALLNKEAWETQSSSSSSSSYFIPRIWGSYASPDSFFLVMEYCQGGDLFEVVANGTELSADNKRSYVRQIMSAVNFIHQRGVGHRDISLENLFLRQDGSLLLADFGHSVPLVGSDGSQSRYFAEAGKSLYRAPEMHVPRLAGEFDVVCPDTGCSPGDIVQVSVDKCRCEVRMSEAAQAGQSCKASLAGYLVAPTDIFSVGVCAFLIIVGRQPWEVARDSDPTFSFVRRYGVSKLLRQWRRGLATSAEAAKEEEFLSSVLRVAPNERLSAEDYLACDWLVDPPSSTRLP